MISREKLSDAVLTALLTRKCCFCGKVIKPEDALCRECAKNLTSVTGERCKYCGALKEHCRCKKRKRKYDGITSPFYYDGSARGALLSLKTGERDYSVRFFARAMAESVLEDFPSTDFDIIVYVPFSSRQKLVRKYNQSRLLAERLSLILKIPVAPALIKLFDTRVQHSLGGRYRSGNVAGVYDVKDICLIKGKTVLLVDDIKTTGATLNECAKILKIRGAARVYCVTAALSVTKDKSKKEER